MKKFFAGVVDGVVASLATCRTVAVAVVNLPNTIEKLSRAEAEVALLAAKLQFQVEEVDGMRFELSNKAGALEIAENINMKDLAKNISRSSLIEAIDITAAEVAENLDMSDNIDMDEIATKVAEKIDIEEMASSVYDKIDMEDLADKVLNILITSYSESRR